jgi:gliding motility-associated-like protein
LACCLYTDRQSIMKNLLLFVCFLFTCCNATAQLSLQFVPNEGQWKESFLYKGTSGQADFYLEQDGITVVVGDAENPEKMHQYKEGKIGAPPTLHFHAYKMKWLQATQQPRQITPSKKQSFYNNYFLGNNRSNWKSKVSVYGNVDYIDLYPNIDLHIGADQGAAKYDFIVKPGGRPTDIALSYEGVDGLYLENGNLIIQTSVGLIQEAAPYAYQYIEGMRKEVPCRFVLKDNVLGFELPKGYDKKVNLIIDPIIEFATLTGATSDNWGFTATYDKDGNLYAGGIVNGSGYPTTTGAFQLTYGGGAPPTGGGLPCDMAISKFNATGDALIYSTFIGGANNEMPHSMVVDADGNLVIAGKTYSTDFPVTVGAYDESSNGGSDIVVSKLTADGSDLVGSTYIGGTGDDGINISHDFSSSPSTLKYNYGDNSRSEVIVDKLGNIYVASSSRSSDFPVTSSAVKSTMTDTQDGVVFKLNPALTALTWSTYVGGSDDDAAYVLALDTSQTKLYVAGGTESSDMFSATMSSGLYSSYQGGSADGFILRFKNSGTYELLNGTYMGTSSYDQCYGVQVDYENSVYAMGQTLGSFPVSTGVYSNPGSPQFLIKLDSVLTTNEYSTVWGSGSSTSPNISPVAFLVDTCQNVYISGWGGTSSPGTTTTGLPTTSDALQGTTDGNDFYFIVFEKNAGSLLYASFFGSASKGEHVDGGTSRFDPQGVVYQAICASCGTVGTSSSFPATPGAWSSTKGSSTTNCNLGAVKIAFNLGSVSANAFATPSSGCAPLTVNFTNESTNALTYEWTFGDGSTSSASEPTHTFTNPGVYNVRMIAINPNACTERDTIIIPITVTNDTMNASFNYTLLDSCENYIVSFVNTSTPVSGGTLATANFEWFFGDGSSFSGLTPPIHEYASGGTYEVILVMTDPNACNSPDTMKKTIIINSLMVTAGISLPDTCLSGAITFGNISANGTSYFWSFGDGATSTEHTPIHTYDTTGSYNVMLVVSNPESCNGSDTAYIVANIFPIPVASFTSTPLIPEANVPTAFVNRSIGATSYYWSFGDGTSSTEANPVHQYQRSGDYEVCLTAINQHGCKNRVCRMITAEVRPLVDVPTAFTPNGDGTNDVLYVRGYGIEHLEFRVYNRWGELVFETNNQAIGWDGTFRGTPQEMDAYAFTLHATFYDGKSVSRKGNVTLIR